MDQSINSTYINWPYLLWITVALLLSGCSRDEEFTSAPESRILVPIEINNIHPTISIATQPYTVNRILVLPFRKTDENAGNTDDHFVPDYIAAKQMDVNSTVSYMTMLNLAENTTYKIMIIGYNRNDYDLSDQSNMNNRFSIGPTDTSALLSNLYLLSGSATSIPEFFTAQAQAYNGNNLVGAYFKTSQIKTVKANLTRIVSGLNLEINNIPDFITSITLVAEKLVKGVRITDLTATAIQGAGESDNLKTLSSQTPTGGKVAFNHFLLPTFQTNMTKLYLDITYGVTTERYVVNVQDTNGVAASNSIIFSPNEVVGISGDYSLINIGFFTINYSINLEDDYWDGLHN